MSSISVVVPVHNAQNTLYQLHDRLVAVLERVCQSWEIVYVDDGSVDESVELLEQLAHSDRHVSAILLPTNVGLHKAAFCGIACCRLDYIATIDDDLYFRPEDIDLLARELIDSRNECVYGVPSEKRNKGALALKRTLIARITKLPPGRVPISSFRLLERELAQRIFSRRLPREQLSVEILLNTPRVGMVPVEPEEDRARPSRRPLAGFWGIIRAYSPLASLFRHHPGFPGWSDARIICSGSSTPEGREFLT
ncbi:MAG: glycosyltransferase [Spirochaetota bacterium]